MKLFTTTIGDGPKRAALVHGLSGDGGTWFELAPWIAEHGYTVTLVDQRGHGHSERAESYLTGELADDLVETLPVGLDLIAGHSLGGRSLLLAAERLRPAKAVYLDPGWEVPVDLVLERPVRADGSELDLDELAAVLPPGYSRAHQENSHRALALFDPAWLVERPDLPDLEPPVPPVVPSLVVLADPSTATPPDMADRLRAGGYVVRVVEGGHHDLHIVNLQETKRVLEDWL